MLARGLVDQFRYNRVGNEVTLVKYFDPQQPKLTMDRPHANEVRRIPSVAWPAFEVAGAGICALQDALPPASHLA